MRGKNFWIAGASGSKHRPPIWEIPARACAGKGGKSSSIGPKSCNGIRRLPATRCALAAGRGIAVEAILLSAVSVLLYRHSNESQGLIALRVWRQADMKTRRGVRTFLSRSARANRSERGTQVRRARLANRRGCTRKSASTSVPGLISFLHWRVPIARHLPRYARRLCSSIGVARSTSPCRQNWRIIRLISGEANAELRFVFSDDGQSVDGCLFYNNDLYDADLIHDLVGHLKNLHSAGIADPSVAICACRCSMTRSGISCSSGGTVPPRRFPMRRCMSCLSGRFTKRPKLRPCSVAMSNGRIASLTLAPISSRGIYGLSASGRTNL